MRSILRQTPYNAFSSNKLNQVITNRIDQINAQHNNNYLKYEELFFKLYTIHLQRQTTVAANVKKLDTICMMSQFPSKSIVQHFLSTAKSYSEDYTVQTFIRLARAYKISQADNSSSADYSINRLFFTPAFQNLIQQYKYGLRKQNAMSWHNAFLVAQCLIDIGYVDYQVFSILLNMVELRLHRQQRNEIQIRPFQIQKRGYYQGRFRGTHQNLIEDNQFRQVLKLLSQKVRSFQQRTKRISTLEQVKRQLSADQQSKNLYSSIQQTVSMIQSFNKDLTKLIQGILVVRKQYRRMVQLSQSKEILRNPGLNLQLLELEQILLSKKLISFNDIKFSERIQNQAMETKRIEEILISLIEPAEGLSINFTNEVGQLLNKNFVQPENMQLQKLNKLKQIGEYGRALSILSRFTEISRRLYNAPDSRSLISMKWQKTLLMWNKQGAQSTQNKQNLHAQKIFRRTFSDLFKMMKRSYSIFMFTFVEAPLKYKIQFFDALTRLGYHEELINIFSNEDFSKEKVQTYSNFEFSSLIKTLNEIGSRVNADHLKKSTVRHLIKLYQNSQSEQNNSLFSMEFCINAINFICQNFKVISVDMRAAQQSKYQIQSLYEKLINRLAQQVKYIEQTDNFLTNDHLYEALRILSVQKLGQYKLNNKFYSRFGINPGNQKELNQFLYRKNPFFSLAKQLIEPYAQSSINKSYPFIQTGFNDKGQFVAVLPCSSNDSSINGKYVVGNINAYITRIRRQADIHIVPLCVNSLVDIDYEKISQGKQFAFKPKQELSNILNSLFKRDEFHLYQFSNIILNITLQLQKLFKKSYLLPVVKFLNTLNQCTKLFAREKQIMSYDLFRFRRCRLFVQLDTLKEDFNFIDKAVKDELEKLWRKETSSVEGLKKNSSILDFVQNAQQNILKSVNRQQDYKISKDFFEGKRFTIDAFVSDNNQFKTNIGIQFINTTAYVDKTFCPYRDWSEQLNSLYPTQTIKLSDANNLTKILTKKYLPNVRQQISVLPWTKKSVLPQKPAFSLSSLQNRSTANDQHTVTAQQQQQQVDSKQQKINQQQLSNIKCLLQFIHQLKLSKSQQQVIQYIFSFDFISNIASQKNSKSHNHQQLLHRKVHSYIEYLEMRNNKLYLESPNLQYLFNKFDHKQQITDVFNSRKERRNLAKIEYQLGKINRKQYNHKLQQIDDSIINKLKQFEKNIVDNVQEYRLFQSGLKMIRIQKDQKQIERVLNRQRYYDRYMDKDFIHVKGNRQRLLKIKRNKAQRILSLYKALYKLSKNQSQAVTEAEKQTIKRQANYILYRLENQKQPQQVFSQKFTHLTIGDLSKADKQRLKLKGIDLSKIQNLCLSDLILEFNNLLDIKVYQNFQKLIFKKHYSSKYKIPEEIFVSSLNKEYSKLAGQQQRAIINEHSKLDFYELGLLNQMVQTFKTQSKTGKQRFAQIYQTFYQDIQQLNNAQARVELISQYLNLKQLQYTERYNPRLVTQIKQRQVMKLWKVIFKKEYKECDTDDIQKITAKICERIRIMGQNPPPFFGLLVIKILEHPQTDALTKQNLIANIQLSKIPLQVDSQDIRVLGQGCNIQQKANNETVEELIQHMASTSNKNFMENLNRKINMIV